MATLAELQAERTQLRTAKQSIEQDGQAMGVDGVTLTRANYSAICKRLDQIERRIARLNGSRPYLQSVNFGGITR